MAVTSITLERGIRQLPGVFNEMWVVNGTLDVSSLSDGVGETQTCAVPGVALGDMVLAFSMGVSLADITATAYVSAADTVSFRFQNESAGTVNLASTSIKFVVVRPAF